MTAKSAKVKTKKTGVYANHRGMAKTAKDKYLRKSYFSTRTLAAFAVLFAAVGGWLVFHSFAASTATVTVTNTTGSAVQTQLSTNIVPYYPLNSVTGAQAKFNTLHPPFVRLHIGHDSTAMPEIVQNQWQNSGESRAFASLDELVNEVYAANQEVLMNIKYAPPWQWTCGSNGGTGTVRDLTFQEFAQYMARLVSYYNKGSMTTEQGATITNPAGTSHKITYWELWNEPDLNNETPCAPANGFGITYQQYTTMWNAVTAAMLTQDSTLKFVGPATAGGQFGSGSSGNQYIDYLMANSVTKPTALSFHGYGYWDNTVSDHWVFDGDGSCSACGGISAFANAVSAVHTSYPTLPIWLTEVNVNADWGNDSHKRPISEFSAAWWGSMFAQNAPMNAGIIHQYDVLDDIQFGLINVNNGNTFLPYHVFALLNQYFPQGSTLLSSSSNTANVLTLAVRTPSGHTSVLVVNRQLANNTVASNCGVGGVPVTVTVNLPATPSAVTIRQLDKNNINCTSNTGTAASSVAGPASSTQSVTFPGYGLAVLDVTPTGGGGSDTTPPVISGVNASGLTSSAATINWTTDENSDSQVDYGTTASYGSSTTLNGTLLTSHSQSLSGLSAGTLYHYRVKSKDAAGNLATGSDFTFTTLAADTTAPTVSITAPANGASLSGSTAVTASASDNVGVVGVQFKLDNVNLQPEDTTSPYSINWDTSSASNGSHTLTAVARDAAGNTTTSTAITITVSNTCPSGDVNGDCHVSITDLSVMLSYYSSTNATCDLNHNGTVDIFDLSILLSHYGQ